MMTKAERELHDAGHCGETEPCADDVYCNCNCDRCRNQECRRPGCTNCGKIHVGDRRWYSIIERLAGPR